MLLVETVGLVQDVPPAADGAPEAVEGVEQGGLAGGVGAVDRGHVPGRVRPGGAGARREGLEVVAGQVEGGLLGEASVVGDGEIEQHVDSASCDRRFGKKFPQRAH